jgi:hypothetical protein
MAMAKSNSANNLKATITRLGGKAWAAAHCGVSPQTVTNWLKAGNLNKAYALHAWKLAQAVHRPLSDFLDDRKT